MERRNFIKNASAIEATSQIGFLDTILYVDLCNDRPIDTCCPYFKNDPPEKTWGFWHIEKSMQYMS